MYGKKYERIQDRLWYHSLVPTNGRGLMNDVPMEQMLKGLVICLQEPAPEDYQRQLAQTGKKKDTIRMFSFFQSFLDFARYWRDFPRERRCFYEVIFGEQAQKPHFDIESKEGQQNLDAFFGPLMDDLIDAIQAQLLDMKVVLKLPIDVLLFTSHALDKRSYHVIIDNYSHRNNDEAAEFYSRVVARMKPEHRAYVDHSVYSVKQQFRIVGCTKCGKNRYKKFEKTWTHHGQTIEYEYREEPSNEGHEFVIQLEASLVTNIAECLSLPSLLGKTTETEPLEGSSLSIVAPEYKRYDISTDLAVRAVNVLAACAGMSARDSDFPYELASISQGIVLLHRKRPSRCAICERRHDNENPYLYLLPSDNGWTVYFHCRRAPDNKKLLVGYLGNNGMDNEVKRVVTTADASEKTKRLLEKQKEERMVNDWAREKIRQLKARYPDGFIRIIEDNVELLPDADPDPNTPKTPEVIKPPSLEQLGYIRAAAVNLQELQQLASQPMPKRTPMAKKPAAPEKVIQRKEKAQEKKKKMEEERLAIISTCNLPLP